MYLAKTAELIEMPFCMSARVDPSNHVLYGNPDPPEQGAILGLENMAMFCMPTVSIFNKTMRRDCGLLSNFFDLLFYINTEIRAAMETDKSSFGEEMGGGKGRTLEESYELDGRENKGQGRAH